jgi:hypothetical protein
LRGRRHLAEFSFSKIASMQSVERSVQCDDAAAAGELFSLSSLLMMMAAVAAVTCEGAVSAFD